MAVRTEMPFAALQEPAAVAQGVEVRRLLEADRAGVEERHPAQIDDDPIAGAPLFEPFKGLWSYRTGDLRIVYRIVIEARDPKFNLAATKALLEKGRTTPTRAAKKKKRAR